MIPWTALLEKKLRAAGSGLSSPAAWQALETIRCVEVPAGRQRKLCVTRGSRQATELLQVVGLSQLDTRSARTEPTIL
jgi:hypothetical protein